MKIIFLLSWLFLSIISYGQTTEETIVEVKIFVPLHLMNEFTGKEQLIVSLRPFDATEAEFKSFKKVAKKVKENIYSFKLPKRDFWVIDLNFGKFGYRMMCVNNEDGFAGENYDFTITLEKGNKDFNKQQFLPPCIRRDEETAPPEIRESKPGTEH